MRRLSEARGVCLSWPRDVNALFPRQSCHSVSVDSRHQRHYTPNKICVVILQPAEVYRDSGRLLCCTAIGRRLHIFYTCAVWSYLHSTCVCVRLNLHIHKPAVSLHKKRPRITFFQLPHTIYIYIYIYSFMKICIYVNIYTVEPWLPNIIRSKIMFDNLFVQKLKQCWNFEGFLMGKFV